MAARQIGRYFVELTDFRVGGARLGVVSFRFASKVTLKWEEDGRARRELVDFEREFDTAEEAFAHAVEQVEARVRNETA